MSSHISAKKRVRTAAAVILFRFLFLAIGVTCRKRELGLEHIARLRKSGKNWIYCTWHTNVSVAVWVLKKQNLALMVSESVDGEKIARVIRSYGNTALRGSTSKGSVKVFRKMLQWLREGRSAGITPDGPRGPKHVLQSGTVALAQKAGCPLVPIHIESTRQWVLAKSWDNHKLPKPFSTIVVVYGPPYCLPRKMDKEEFESRRLEFEKIMREEALRLERDIFRHR